MGGLGFPKMRGTILGGPYNKDQCILGSILGSPLLFRESTICVGRKMGLGVLGLGNTDQGVLIGWGHTA